MPLKMSVEGGLRQMSVPGGAVRVKVFGGVMVVSRQADALEF